MCVLAPRIYFFVGECGIFLACSVEAEEGCDVPTNRRVIANEVSAIILIFSGNFPVRLFNMIRRNFGAFGLKVAGLA